MCIYIYIYGYIYMDIYVCIYANICIDIDIYIYRSGRHLWERPSRMVSLVPPCEAHPAAEKI